MHMIYNQFEASGWPQLPNPDRLLFFENQDWTPQDYTVPFDSGAAINQQANNNASQNSNNASQNSNNAGWSSRGLQGQARYNEMQTYFTQPRYVAQKVLGFGGNGLAAHFRDRGPDDTDVPGRDIVIKVALPGWSSNMIVKEKKMMRVSCPVNVNYN